MDQMYGVAYSEDFLMHYRTKGSKNGYSSDPNYKPIGQKAQDNPRNMQEYAAIMQRQAAQQASQKEKEEATRKRQVAMQRIGWLAGKAVEGVGNAVKTSVGTGLQLANQKAEEMTAKERAKKEEARLQQAQYKKARDEGRAYERARQSAYSKAKGAAHYKVEEGKRAVNKAVRAGKKTLSEVSADIKKKGRDTLAKLGVGDAARDAGRIAERAKEAVSGALEKGRKKATKFKNQYNIAKNDATVKRHNQLISEGYTQTKDGDWRRDNGKSVSYVITKNGRKRR